MKRNIFLVAFVALCLTIGGMVPVWTSGVSARDVASDVVASPLYLDITMGDNEWIGLGASAGRIVFSNQSPDVVGVMSADVGIGTLTPGRKLEVVDGDGAAMLITRSGNDMVFLGDTGGDNAGGLFLYNVDGSLRSVVKTDGTDTIIGSYNSANLELMTGGSTRMTIDTSGNVSIGDTTPSYELDVDGDIRATGDLRADNDLFVADNLDVTGIAHADERLEIGPDAADLASIANVTMVTQNEAGGALWYFNDDLESSTDIFGSFNEFGITSGYWVDYMVCNITQGGCEQGSLIGFGEVDEELVSRPGGNSLDFVIYRITPGEAGRYTYLRVNGTDDYSVALRIWWN